MLKTVILAGGLGTRLQTPTEVRPKPMIEIGGRPLLRHIMGIYAAAGFTEFVVAMGYKASYVKDFFAQNGAGEQVTPPAGAPEVLSLRYQAGPGGRPALRAGAASGSEAPQPPAASGPQPWTVHLADTGEGTQTGGRLRRLRPLLHRAPFMLTYGDGLADIDLRRLVAFHQAQGKLATVTAVRPPARFGALNLAEGEALVRRFDEKPQTESGWINGGFFVLEPGIFDYLSEGDDLIWERGPLERLAADGQLAAFRHEGFWHPIDTPREKAVAEELWQRGDAPWPGA